MPRRQQIPALTLRCPLAASDIPPHEGVWAARGRALRWSWYAPCAGTQGKEAGW